MTFDVLAISGTILSSVAAVYALFQVVLSVKAETHLIKKLVAEKYLTGDIEKRLTQLQSSQEELRAEIERTVETLDSQDRERIKDALYQPSIEGRANYLSKLAEESAKTLEQQLQP